MLCNLRTCYNLTRRGESTAHSWQNRRKLCKFLRFAHEIQIVTLTCLFLFKLIQPRTINVPQRRRDYIKMDVFSYRLMVLTRVTRVLHLQLLPSTVFASRFYCKRRGGGGGHEIKLLALSGTLVKISHYVRSWNWLFCVDVSILPIKALSSRESGNGGQTLNPAKRKVFWIILSILCL